MSTPLNRVISSLARLAECLRADHPDAPQTGTAADLIDAATERIAALREYRDRAEEDIARMVKARERYRAVCKEYRAELTTLRGAAAADEERMIAAATKAGIPYYDCDTPDWLAEEVVGLRAELAVHKEALRIQGHKILNKHMGGKYSSEDMDAWIDAALAEARKKLEGK